MQPVPERLHVLLQLGTNGVAVSALGISRYRLSQHTVVLQYGALYRTVGVADLRNFSDVNDLTTYAFADRIVNSAPACLLLAANQGSMLSRSTG